MDDKDNLTKQIIFAMGLGMIVGVSLSFFDHPIIQTYFVDGAFYVGGKVFVKLLKMLVVPLVLISLICGVMSLSDIKQLGRIGGMTLSFYLLTTAIAITLAITAGLIFSPGEGFSLVSESVFEAKTPPPLTEVLINIVPGNPLESMASGKMLQVIVFAILLGLSINICQAKKIEALCLEANDVIMKMLTLLMKFAPVGVFCLMAKVFATLGADAFIPLIKYFLLVLCCLIFHGLVSYPSLLKLIGGLNPVTFINKFKQVWVYAFSTASSNATMPVTLDTVQKKLGVSNGVASFSVPLGATINMDGTAIMQGVATVFISQVYGVNIDINGYLMVILTATLASIGTAGVPGVGLITLAMVLNQVGLPVEGIGLIIGIDRLLDMVRTAVNVTGDAAVSCIVAKKEGELDRAVFNS